MKEVNFIENVIFKRFLVSIGIIVSSFFIFYSFFTQHYEWTIINSIALLLLILLFIFPRNLIYLGLVSFLYGCCILIYFPEEHGGISFFAIGCISFAIQGFYHHKKILKISLTGILYFACLLSESRFGLYRFLHCFYKSLIYTVIVFLIFLLIYFYILQLMELNPKKQLDLTKSDFTEEELIIFYLLIKNCKIDYISLKLNLSNSTVKRRVKEIYNFLGVQDIICFNGKTARMNIIFPKEIIEKCQKIA